MSVLMTGFPGFLGSALLPRLLARHPRSTALCVVQPQHLADARARLAGLDPGTAGRVRLLEGDITRPGLGLSTADRRSLRSVTDVWHLAAVYDLAVGPDVAHRVNVGGTEQVLDLCAGLERLRRFDYVSTCYVSGDHAGVFSEDSLEEGQRFRNHYESTKHAAEVLVRKALADGLPATVYRPGIVVGDSRTGATQKYDGPYYVAAFLRRQPPVALVPRVAPPDVVTMSLVPRDFVVDAMDMLSALDASRGRTYALTDPAPPTIREVVETFAHHLGRRVVWVPLPLGATRLIVGSTPGAERVLGLPAEALDYLASRTTYSTTHTTADLAGSGLSCPRFSEYADRLLDYMAHHPDIDAKAMV